MLEHLEKKENNQVKILVETIAKSIIDPYRHQLDVVDWGIAKNKTQSLKRSDFEDILQLPLSEVLKMYENSLK